MNKQNFYTLGVVLLTLGSIGIGITPDSGNAKGPTKKTVSRKTLKKLEEKKRTKKAEADKKEQDNKEQENKKEQDKKIQIISELQNNFSKTESNLNDVKKELDAVKSDQRYTLNPLGYLPTAYNRPLVEVNKEGLEG